MVIFGVPQPSHKKMGLSPTYDKGQRQQHKLALEYMAHNQVYQPKTSGSLNPWVTKSWLASPLSPRRVVRDARPKENGP